MANLVSPCHGADIYVHVTYDADEGDSVTIWCGEPTCHNTWDHKGVIEDEYVGEDPFEYAVQRTLVNGTGATMIVGEYWSTLNEVNVGLLNLSTERTDYTLVKRLKAGKVQKA